MGIRVTAAQAAALVGRHERIIRWHIGRGDLPAQKQGNAWRIDTDDLARIPGWHVDAARLADVQAHDERTATALSARIEALERQVRDLTTRLRALEMAKTGATSAYAPVARSEGQEGGLPASPSSDTSVTPYRAPFRYGGDTGASYGVSSGAYSGASYSASRRLGDFANRGEAARWLLPHGIHSEGTPKSWPGWREVELSPRAVLTLALSLCDPRNHRITWRLHPCDDAQCICHELLDGGRSE
jgi:hypothetical protein